MTKIYKSKSQEGLYYVNGKLLFIEMWNEDEGSSGLTTKEKKDFSNYLKAVKENG